MRIDIHSHLISVTFLEHLQGRDTLPTAVPEADGYVTHCAPGLSLRYGPPILSVEAKLADMDAAGIDLAVLSHGLPGPHVLGGAQADRWAARINDELAAVSAAHPGRLAGWASLGFGDPSRTIAEADRCLDELGLAGFQVWSNLGDRPLDDPGVLPVLEHIAARGAAIHLHPAPPPGPPGLAPVTMLGLAFPADTSLAVLRLISAGLFDRDPVIIAAHLGGVLPWLRERIGLWDQNLAPLPGQRHPARPAGEYLDRLYVDAVGYGPAPLEYCYTQLGAGRLLFGTDHPYAAPGVPQDLVDRLPCTQAEREQILAGNAQRLLRLGTTVPGRALGQGLAGPGQEEDVWHDQRVRVGEMTAGRGVERLESGKRDDHMPGRSLLHRARRIPQPGAGGTTRTRSVRTLGAGAERTGSRLGVVLPGAAGGHDEQGGAAEEISCLCPRVQPGPPLAGPLAGQDALVVQMGHMSLENSPEERRVREIDHGRDGHVGQSGGPQQAGQFPPDAAVDRGVGERADDDPGRFGVGMVDERRLLVEFEHPDPAARPGHAGHLPDDAGRVRHVLQDGGRPAGVEGLVRVGQVGGVAGAQRHPGAEAGGAPPRLGDHRLADVDTRYVSAVRHEPRHVRYVYARTAAHVQGGAGPSEGELLQ